MTINHGTLPTHALGTTDMAITRVGFGAWAIGGAGWAFGWGTQDDRDSVAAIRHAVESGINWIDTAAIYGLGHSEEVVAQALDGFAASDRPYVFTKCGLVPDPANPAGNPSRIGARASIFREVEGSLLRLKTERIDLYQMHWPSGDGTPLEEYWEALLDLKLSGKVRAVGLSNHDAGQLQVAETLGHVDTLQPPFSAIKRAAAAAELPWCAEHDTGVIVYSPMQSGLLTGAFTAERAAALPQDDWRSRSAEFTGDGLTRNLALAAGMERVATRHGKSAATVALAWTLAWPGVTGAIVGARKPDQIDGWIDAATFTLDPRDLEEIAESISSSGAGNGPALPPSPSALPR